MTTREDIHKIKQAMDCACNNNAYLSTIATVTLRANWTTIVGNSIDYTYYTGVAPGNPSGDVNNVETAEYFTGTTLIFTQTFTYDANDNCINITTT
jgi:hypothetical protein